jgi:PAS domain S-box-containing protein
MRLRTDRKIALAVGSGSLLVIAVATIGMLSTRRLVNDALWVAHTHDVRGQLRELTTHVDGAKADVRGFLLTGDSTYLVRQATNLAAVEVAFQRLLELTSDNAVEQQRLGALRGLFAERKSALLQTIPLRARPDELLARVQSRLAIGESLSARIDSVVQSIDTTERDLLAVRLKRQAESERLVAGISVALVLGFVGVAVVVGRSISRDFTGRVRAEAELRASEAKFAGILAIAADAIISIDESQSIVHFNHGAEEIFGYERAEVLGRPLEMLLPARHAGAHREHVASFASSGDASRRMGERRQINGRRKNGKEFPAEASISRLQTPSGSLFTAVVRDVTERQRLEAHEHALAMASVELGQSLEYEDTVVAAANLPVPVVGAWSVLDVIEDADGAEPLLRRVVSHHPDPAINGALREWEAEPLDWDAPDAVIDVLRTGELQRIASVSNDWLEAHTSSARQIDIVQRMGMNSLIIVPLVARERVLGALTIGSSAEHTFDEYDCMLARDLADRAALEIEKARLFRRAQRATSARDQVLSVVSHDLRNPLSAVSMLAGRLVENPPGEDERREIGKNILASADWMQRLMQDLLDAASIDAGRLSVESEPNQLYQIVHPVIDMFAARASSRGIALRLDLPAEGCLVLADGERIIQVLGNLVANALKFTPDGGTISIGAARAGREVVLHVCDTGAGIPAADLPRVFDRFWHARRNSTTRGTGLGLAIAQGIVRAHGGRMWVESVEGEGSTFFFTLPIATLSAPVVAGRFSTAPAPYAKT